MSLKPGAGEELVELIAARLGAGPAAMRSGCIELDSLDVVEFVIAIEEMKASIAGRLARPDS